MLNKMSLLIFSVVIIVLQTQHTAAKKLPSYVHVCKRTDPQMNECLLKTIESVRPELPNGVPKLQIPALEPMVIPRLQVNRNDDSLKVKATITDVMAWGGSKFVLNNLKINLEKLTGEATVIVPNLFVNCTYDIDGRIMVIPLKGKGTFNGTITNVRVDIKGSAETLKDKKNRDYFQLKNIRLKVKVGDATGKVKNLSRGGEVITETAMTFFHQNRRLVLDLVSPIVEEIAVEFAMQIGNNVLKTILYDEILPVEL
ncbi:circadian clock-controlled protein daywake-like [Daktulosphaira vitifoliae]|uniref:circadian clock-controlled protein daywake-like n=1 Tax=Daktulosphaira vitifoliae TaxID=58002 RepID=UPI0021AAD46E|nr:circadian clock-controlled protein daywake-like [Daktulosphaira vitifoliae]